MGDLLRRTKEKAPDSLYEIKEMLKSCFFCSSEIRMGELVADKQIDPKLLMAGVSAAKIINLSEADRARLMSDEKFEFADGMKNFMECSPYDRKTLLGFNKLLPTIASRREYGLKFNSMKTANQITHRGDYLVIGNISISISTIVGYLQKNHLLPKKKRNVSTLK